MRGAGLEMVEEHQEDSSYILDLRYLLAIQVEGQVGSWMYGSGVQGESTDNRYKLVIISVQIFLKQRGWLRLLKE